MPKWTYESSATEHDRANPHCAPQHKVAVPHIQLPRELNQMAGAVVQTPSLARFLPIKHRAVGSKREIVRFSTVVSNNPPRGGALLPAPFVTLSREVTTHEDP
jgi:hypothetical protein